MPAARALDRPIQRGGAMNRYWTLSDKPLANWPQPDTFELHDGPMPKPGPGQALSRTIYVSLDPYQWGYKRRRVETPGAPCHARTVSQVIESHMDGFAAGDLVFNTNGWAEYGLMGEGVVRPSYMVPRRLDPAHGRISQAGGEPGGVGADRPCRLGVEVRGQGRRDGVA